MQSQSTTPDCSHWVTEYGDALFAYAMKRVNDRDAAEELVQDALLSGLKNQATFSGQSQEKTWLIGILKHKVLDYYRKYYRNQAREVDCQGSIDDHFTENGMWSKPVGDWGDHPERDLQNSQFLAVLDQCMEHLPEKQRRVFKTRVLDELTTEEVCNIFGISATNLGVQLFRARAQVRDCIEMNWFEKDSPQGETA